MTTGTFSQNDISPLPWYDPNYYSIEFYKSWSGLDRVSSKRVFYPRAEYVPQAAYPSNYKGKHPRLSARASKVRLVAVHRTPVQRRPRLSIKDSPHSWSMQTYTRKRLPGTQTSNGVTTPSPVGSWDVNYGYPAFSANDDIALIAKLRASVLGSSFDLGVFLGEGYQSLKMIGDAAIRLARGITAIKQGRFLRAASILVGSAHKQVLKGKKRARLLALESSYRELDARATTAKAVQKFAVVSPWLQRRKSYLDQQRTRVRKLPDDLLVLLPVEGRTKKKVSAAAWLELQYGWKPLVSDLRAGAESLAEATLPKRKRYFVRKKASLQTGFCELYNAAPAYCNPRSYKMEASKQIVAYIEEQNVPSMLHVLDWKTVAWELTPWSFVVDWAIPIGEYLSARGFAQEVKGTFVITQRQYLNCRDFVGTLGGTSFRFKGTSVVAAQYIRSVSSSLDVPTPEVKGFGQIPSWSRAANAVALLIQKHH